MRAKYKSFQPLGLISLCSCKLVLIIIFVVLHVNLLIVLLTLLDYGLIMIHLHTKSTIIDKIKENLEDRLTNKFRGRIFWHFLEFSMSNQSSQLLL